MSAEMSLLGGIWRDEDVNKVDTIFRTRGRHKTDASTRAFRGTVGEEVLGGSHSSGGPKNISGGGGGGGGGVRNRSKSEGLIIKQIRRKCSKHEQPARNSADEAGGLIKNTSAS